MREDNVFTGVFDSVRAEEGGRVGSRVPSPGGGGGYGHSICAISLPLLRQTRPSRGRAGQGRGGSVVTVWTVHPTKSGQTWPGGGEGMWSLSGLHAPRPPTNWTWPGEAGGGGE